MHRKRHRKIGLHYGPVLVAAAFCLFLLNINYRTHIIEKERQSRKIAKVTKLSLDDVLCGTSLGLKELIEGNTSFSALSYFPGQFQASICLASVISPPQVF